MSNFSNIGFDVKSEEDFLSLIEKVHEKSVSLKTSKGTYFQYSDKSGAELWVQMNNKNQVIGANPHFKGKSNRKVSVTSSINRSESILDGAFHSWANPTEMNEPESGDYPFVFDVPNHKKHEGIETPQIVEIQLSAFAQEMEYYESEDAFDKGQKEEMKWASQSFVPSGLFNPDSEGTPENPEAFGLFAGIIRETEKRRNELSGNDFYWMLVDTLGGEIDVLADPNFFDKDLPKPGGVIHGQFWLSGYLLKEPKISEVKKVGFFKKLFGSN